MKALLKKVSASLLLVSALSIGLVAASPLAVSAQNCQSVGSQGVNAGANCVKPASTPTNLFGQNSVFLTVTNIMLFVIGAIAVVMLIVGGIKYVVSQGDQNAITSAKNTILYAIIGIVVAFLAFAAVNFVSAQLNTGTSTTTTTP